MAPGHQWALPAPEAPDVSAQIIAANPDRRAGCQLEGLACISLPGSSAARGDLLLGFRSDKVSINFPIVFVLMSRV